MVLGKLCLILACSVSHAQSWQSSTYKGWYQHDGVAGFVYNLSRHFAAKLDRQDAAFHSRAVYFALTNSETGELIEWYNDQNYSHGKVKIIATWTGNGDICRRVYSYVIANRHNHTYEDTACYNNTSKTWNFVDKY